MHEVARRLLLTLCAIAFIGGTMIGIAMHPAAAGETCAGHRTDGKTDHHRGMKNGNCVACCVGACVAIPDLQSRGVSNVVPRRPATVAYSVYGVTISGRSVMPDADPPKLGV